MIKSKLVLLTSALMAISMTAMADSASCPSVNYANGALAAYNAAGNPTSPINYNGWMVYDSPAGPPMPNRDRSLEPMSMFLYATWNMYTGFANQLVCTYSSVDYANSLSLYQVGEQNNPIPDPNPSQYWVQANNIQNEEAAVCGPNTPWSSKATDPSQCAWTTSNAN